MLGYPIDEQLINYNRPGEPLTPKGVVIHATSDPGATAQNERDYFNGAYRGASAHYFVDWKTIIRTIPENEVAWHAGPTANHRFLSVEMCEPLGHDWSRFIEVWNRTVWLVADMCLRHDWSTELILSHKEVSDLWHETDHTDPIGYLSQYHKEWGELLLAINNNMNAMRNPDQGLTPVKIAVDGVEIDGFLYNGYAYGPVREIVNHLNNLATRQVIWDDANNNVTIK